MSQAISLMPALNGYGTLTEDASGSITEDTATETFLTARLAKVLKINNICDNAHLADCGINTSFTNIAGSKIPLPTTLYELSSWFKHIEFSESFYSTIDTKAAAFETQNGENIVAYYNQSCRTEYLNQDGLTAYGDVFGFPQANMCVNFIYDLNGTKGPNTVGKDIGIMTVFNATDSNVVAPMPLPSDISGLNWYDATKTCSTHDSNSRLPNIDEITALFINENIVSLTEGKGYWSSSVYNTGRVWCVGDAYGIRNTNAKTVMSQYTRCIKR